MNLVIGLRDQYPCVNSGLRGRPSCGICLKSVRVWDEVRSGVQTVKLKLNVDSLRMRRKGSITGEIWLELGDKSFPEQRWSDFPTAVTSALLGAALQLRKAASAAKEEVWFLDGPYYVMLKQVQDSVWAVSLRNLDGFLYAESNVDASSSYASIRAGAAKLVSECESRSWQHPDISIIKDLLNAPI
jgi:hypothetical protein